MQVEKWNVSAELIKYYEKLPIEDYVFGFAKGSSQKKTHSYSRRRFLHDALESNYFEISFTQTSICQIHFTQ